jgi:hypothetical protein
MVLYLSVHYRGQLPRLWLHSLGWVQALAWGVAYASSFCTLLLLIWMCVENECMLGVGARPRSQGRPLALPH